MAATAAAAAAAGAAAAASAPPVDLGSAHIAVMTTPACPYCKRAKEALREGGYAYVEVLVDTNEELRQRVRDVTGKRTVPQVFVGGRSMGGSDDLLQQLGDGSFAAAVQQATSSGTPALPGDLADLAVQALERQAAAAAASSSGGGAAAVARLAQLRQLEAKMISAEGGLPRTELQLGGKTYKAFSNTELLAWLAAQPGQDAPPPPPASVAQELMDALIVAAVPHAARGQAPSPSGSKLMLVAEAPPPRNGEALNVQFPWAGPARPANEVSDELRGLILQLYSSYLSDDGYAVNYKGIRSDARFALFVAKTAELQKVDLQPLTRPQLMAFAINLYNALIIHALVVYGTRMSTVQRSRFYSQDARYNLGGHDYTADDLENGILRGNRSAASNLFNLVGLPQFSGGQFRGGDPRLAKVVQPCDPRIHFALVCGAKSCPPIKVYTPDNLEEGLQGAAEAFLQGEVEVDPGRREVRLSKILKWYRVDFGNNKSEVLRFVQAFLAPPAQAQLAAMLADGQDIKVVYKEYDWSLNGTDDE